jgi:cytochrome oxidase Cu insertion factor (SCO1/SenC/PrrC family)
MRGPLFGLLSVALAMGVAAVGMAAQQPAPGQQPAASQQPELKVGDLAPDFTLPATDGQTYTLSKLRGKTVVLAWFPKAFTAG